MAERALVHRSRFTSDLLEFDAPTIKQILDKCTMLQESPEEGGKAKARLTGRTDGLHRLRAGKFRIFYTYDDEKVSLWAVRRKTVKGQYRGKKGGDVTYDGIDEVEDDDLDLDIPELAPQPSFETGCSRSRRRDRCPSRSPQSCCGHSRCRRHSTLG